MNPKLIWEKKDQVTANAKVEALVDENHAWQVYVHYGEDEERVYFFQGIQMTRRGALRKARQRYNIAHRWAWSTFSTEAERIQALNRALEDYPYG
jgi:hypothetical protein